MLVPWCKCSFKRLKKISDETPHTEVHILHLEVYFSTYVCEMKLNRLLVTTETLRHWLYCLQRIIFWKASARIRLRGQMEFLSKDSFSERFRYLFRTFLMLCLYKVGLSVWMQWIMWPRAHLSSKKCNVFFLRRLSFIWRQASTIKRGARLKNRRCHSSRLEFSI